VYPENNREVMMKLCLEPERSTKTNPIYASAGCPKYVDNPKEIWSEICKRSAYLRSYLFRTGDA
jgi:hypothetical protein